MQAQGDAVLDAPRALPAIFVRYPRLTAIAAGAVGAFGYPPYGLWPLALLAIGLLGFLVWSAASWKRAALIGWLWGWSHLSVANNWIATAFTHQGEMPAFLGWIAVPLLCVYLAIYPALAALAAWRATRGRGANVFVLAFAAAWIVTEWLRSWVFTGYPWPPLGLTLLGPLDRPGWASLLPWLGTYALSGMVVLFGAWLVLFAYQRRWAWLAGGSALLAAGMYLPGGNDAAEGTLRYTLVQPDLDQAELNDPRQYEPAFLTLAALSAREDDAEPRIVLWPESGLPDYLRPGYPARYYAATTAQADPDYARQRIGNVIGENSLLLTGAQDLRIETVDGAPKATGAYNAVTAIDSEGELIGSYAKAHLVPYGEYLALRWLLEPLGASRLVAGTIDFIPGPGPATQDFGRFGRVGVQICYEIVFSGQVTERGNRPDYIFNPSNDGWFSYWGPPQHLAQARMRAIEEGLPVLRSTTTGISAVIDADGVVRDHLGPGVLDRMEGFVPPAKSPTLFSRMGNALAILWALVLIGAAYAASSVARRRTRG